MSTPQHHIIKETSESISRLLQDEFKGAGYKRVHMVEEAPKPDAVEGKLPAVSIYLYQVSVDPAGTDGNAVAEIIEEQDDKGNIIEFKRRRRLWLRLDYLISTWAQTPEDEQILLGLAVRAMLDNPAVARQKLRGDSFEEDFELWLAMSSRLDEGTLARFWGGLSQPVRPAIQVWTSVPIIPTRKKQITRVTGRDLNFRDLNSLSSDPESGPAREVLSRGDFEPGGR